MAVRVSVTVTQVNEDGSESPAGGELATTLAGPVARFSSMVAWTADAAAGLDHAEREKEILESGRDLQRQLLEATFAIDSAREGRIGSVTSAAGIRRLHPRRPRTGGHRRPARPPQGAPRPASTR